MWERPRTGRAGGGVGRRNCKEDGLWRQTREVGKTFSRVGALGLNPDLLHSLTPHPHSWVVPAPGELIKPPTSWARDGKFLLSLTWLTCLRFLREGSSFWNKRRESSHSARHTVRVAINANFLSFPSPTTKDMQGRSCTLRSVATPTLVLPPTHTPG